MVLENVAFLCQRGHVICICTGCPSVYEQAYSKSGWIFMKFMGQ